MFENPRRGRQARNFTTNVPKILDLKSSSAQIFSRKLSLGAPIFCNNRVNSFFKINLNVKERIKAIVTENRKSLASGKMGSKARWKKVDALSKRKERSNPSFDEDSVREFNHYFANLCHDEDYITPVTMDITENIPAPQLTLSQAYYALLETKQTSTGP